MEKLLESIVSWRHVASVSVPYICLTSHLGHQVWPTCLSHLSVCLSACWPQTSAEWGAAIFGVCSAFINTSLLGDKLMSPGSLIATSQLLWVTPDTFLCYITVGAPHHMLWATFATNSGLFQTGEGFFSAQREHVGGDARAHIRTGCFYPSKYTWHLYYNGFIPCSCLTFIWHSEEDLLWRTWVSRRGDRKEEKSGWRSGQKKNKKQTLCTSSDTLTNWT